MRRRMHTGRATRWRAALPGLLLLSLGLLDACGDKVGRGTRARGPTDPPPGSRGEQELAGQRLAACLGIDAADLALDPQLTIRAMEELCDLVTRAGLERGIDDTSPPVDID